jgi:hypothetical protein
MFAMCPIDVSSANNRPKPVIPSAMSLINTKNKNRSKTDDKDSLQDMVNLDLAYLKDWLVKFNQNKTEIMVFSTRHKTLFQF